MDIYLLGSRRLRVGLDSSSRVQEVHYPMLGLDNHTPNSTYHRIGIFVDGKLSWIDEDGGWLVSRKTAPRALIPYTTAENKELGIVVEFIDVVDDDNDTFIRSIHIVNAWNDSRHVKLFMHQGFIFRSNPFDVGSGSYSSSHKAIVHHGRGVAFALNLIESTGRGFDQHTIGRFGSDDLQGTYMDAIDGVLERCDHDIGTVDSTLGISLDIAPHASSRAYYLMSATQDSVSALELVSKMTKSDIAKRIHESSAQWSDWLKPALQVVDRMEDGLQGTFLTSLMSIRSRMDSSGAIMTHRPANSALHSSPQLACFALWPLIRLGYHQEVESYFNFMLSATNHGQQVKSSYLPDGSEGYSPFLDIAKPKQKDSSSMDLDSIAMLVFMFAQLHGAKPSKKLLEKYYESFIVPLLDKLSEQVDRASGLTLDSYSIFNQDKPSKSLFTSSLTYAALLAGADLAELKRDAQRAVGWRSVADEVYRGVNNQLGEKETWSSENTDNIDSLFDIRTLKINYGLFMFGLVSSDNERLIYGYENFKNKYIDQPDRCPKITIQDSCSLGQPGEDFPIPVFWHAQYATEIGNQDDALHILRWLRDTYIEPRKPSSEYSKIQLSDISHLWTRVELANTILDLITEPGERGQ